MKAGATTHRNGVPRASATHVIRIQWGYWMLYGNYGVQHADHSWDGALAARDGEILRCWLLEFSGYAGPGRESLLPLPEPRWHWQPANANNRMGGVVFELRGGADSLVSFCTRTIDFSFSVEQLAARNVLRFHVGPRYSNVDVIVTLDGYDPELDHASDLAALTRGDGRFRALPRGRGHARSPAPLVPDRLVVGHAAGSGAARDPSSPVGSRQVRRGAIPQRHDPLRRGVPGAPGRDP